MRLSSLPATLKFNVAAMVVAIVGIVVQIAAGVDHDAAVTRLFMPPIVSSTALVIATILSV